MADIGSDVAAGWSQVSDVDTHNMTYLHFCCRQVVKGQKSTLSTNEHIWNMMGGVDTKQNKKKS